MSILKNNKVIAVGDVNTYRPPILSCMWSDHIINDIQWLRADTFSWQSGDVYKTVYNKLLEEYSATTKEQEITETWYKYSSGEEMDLFFASKDSELVVGSDLYNDEFRYIGTITAIDVSGGKYVDSGTSESDEAGVDGTERGSGFDPEKPHDEGISSAKEKIVVSNNGDIRNLYTSADFIETVQRTTTITVPDESTENGVTFRRTASGFKIVDASQESAILSKYNTDGISWYYILDTINQRFKLPRTKFGFEGLRGNVGDDIGESLPNIKGDVGRFKAYATYQTDAFYSHDNDQTSEIGCVETLNAGGWGTRIGFDASGSSSTYKDNAPVQERATQMYLYFYVGEYAQTAIEQTAGLNAELFNGKADVSVVNTLSTTVNNKMNKDFSNASNLATINPMIISYVNGTSGYNIWANGYCEQWFQVYVSGTSASNAQVLYLSKTFKNVDYSVTGTMVDAVGTSFAAGVRCAKYVERMELSSYSKASTYSIVASGYLADGQY